MNLRLSSRYGVKPSQQEAAITHGPRLCSRLGTGLAWFAAAATPPAALTAASDDAAETLVSRSSRRISEAAGIPAASSVDGGGAFTYILFMYVNKILCRN